MTVPFCFQFPPDVTHWRPASCMFPVLQCASTASTSCWKTIISPCPKCPPYLNCPLNYPRSPSSSPHWLPDSTSYLNKSFKFPSRFCSFLSTSLLSPRSFPLSLNDFLAGFPKDFPDIHRSCLILHNTSPVSLNTYPILHIIYPIFLSTCPAFLGSVTPLFRVVWAASDLKTMPKPQQQSRGLELDHLVRQSPLQISRTPSPSSPGSVLDLPNVPSYPRLPPISPSCQLSGVSNPTFNAEDELTSARPSGDPFPLWSFWWFFFKVLNAVGHCMTFLDALAVHCV